MPNQPWYRASGQLSVSPPLPSARVVSGGDAAPGRLGSFSVYTTKRHPYSDKLMEGFKWDERVWYQEDLENIAHTVPVNWDPTSSGITTTYFQSGIGDGRDIRFEHVKDLYSSGIFSDGVYRPWVPVLYHGYYYDFNEEGYMYSDDSEVVQVSASGMVPGILTDCNQAQLLSIPKVGVPIRAERWRWSAEDGKHYIETTVRKVAEFTGKRDADGARQSTFNHARQAILWEMIDDTEPEFMVINSGTNQDPPYVVFNQDMNGRYPSYTEYDEVGRVTGVSPLQQFHTTYAPIADDPPVEVYSYLSASGVWRQWEPISMSGDFQGGSGSYEVRVDPDLGILEFGSLTASGINVPPRGHTVVAQYNRSIRVEYEPEWSTDLATGLTANVNPIYRTSGRGFGYLATKAHDATQISLTADATSIGSSLYGPVFIGNTYLPIIATVTDDLGVPVEGAGVEIAITSDPPPGRFGSFGESAFAISNNLGQAKAYYNPPIGIGDIGETILYNGYTRNESANKVTLKAENLLLEGSLNDIFLYKIFTNDPLQGWFEPSASGGEFAQQKAYHKQYFADEDIWGPTGLAAAETLHGMGLSEDSADWETRHRTAWNMLQAEIFDATVNTGRKVLCATYDGRAYNPHTFEFGAVAPFQPIAATPVAGGGYNVDFDISQYDLPIPSGSHTVTASGNLHGYFMVAPTTVSLRASTYNSRLNQTIYSNEIRIKLQIPSYLSGMWYIDAINNTHIEEISDLLETGMVTGSGVPLGFRLKSTNITLAAALDGVTFLDVNPHYNAPIWSAEQPHVQDVGTVGSGVLASGTYAQHRFTVDAIV